MLYKGMYWIKLRVKDSWYEIHFKMPYGVKLSFNNELLKYLSYDAKKFTEHHFINESIAHIYAFYGRIGNKQTIRKHIFHKSSSGRIQKVKNKTALEVFNYTLYGQKDMNNLNFDVTLLNHHLQHQLETYKHDIYYLVPGMTFTIKCNEKNEKHKYLKTYPEFLHIYSKQLRPRPQSIMNLKNVGAKKDMNQDFFNIYKSITIPKGMYTTKSFIEKLNQQIQMWMWEIDMKLDSNGFLTINVGSQAFIDLREIQHLFNLPMQYMGPNEVYKSLSPIQIVPDTHNIIIFSNIVGESVVGGQRERILRIFPIKNHSIGSNINESMLSVDYYPLYYNHIKEIEIQFRGDDGEYIPIHQGRSYVKLHFRRVSESKLDYMDD